jgi:Flp pilus assembly protein TadG
MTVHLARSAPNTGFRAPPNRKTSSRLPRAGRTRHGVATTEFAICFPILMAFLFGCYETSRAYMMQHAAESAAYEAARAGIIPNATPAQCRLIAENVLRSVGVRNFNLNVSPSPIQQQSPTISVTIEVPLRENTAFGPMFFRDVVLRGQCEMQRETF